MNGKRVSFREKSFDGVFDVWRTKTPTNSFRSVSGFDSRVATSEIARSTDPPPRSGRIGLNVNVRQDRQDGFPVRRARATPHAPFRRRCDSVRIATNARVCARRDSPCGPARGSRGAGQRDAGNKKRKSTSGRVLTSALARDKRRDHARGRRLDGSSRALARWTVATRSCHRRGRRRRAVASARGRATPSAPATRVAPPTTRGAGRRSSGRRVTHLCVARQAQPRGVRAAEHQRFR